MLTRNTVLLVMSTTDHIRLIQFLSQWLWYSLGMGSLERRVFHPVIDTELLSYSFWPIYLHNHKPRLDVVGDLDMSIELPPIGMLIVLDPEILKSRLLSFPSRLVIAFNNQMLVEVLYIQTIPRSIPCYQDHQGPPTKHTYVVVDKSRFLSFRTRSSNIGTVGCILLLLTVLWVR